MLHVRQAALCLAATLACTFAPSAALSAPAAPQQAVRAAPLRIMPIGDSITEGDNGGYRFTLWQLISQSAGMPNFVGRRSGRLSDPPEFPDDEHEGYSAYRIEQITEGAGFWNAPPIEQRLKDWDPAVVTIHAGTNDAQQNYFFDGNPNKGIAPVIDRLDDLVSRIVAYNPAIYIVVAQIIPANPPASEVTSDYVRRLNALIPGLVARHQALGHRVSMVDQYTPMLAHPNPDGIHPSAEGAQVMGRVFFEGLRQLGVLPTNPDPGRDDGIHQVDNWTTGRPQWQTVPNLIRAGSPTLAAARTTGYNGSHAIEALNDGRLDVATNDGDNLMTSTFTLDTRVNARGYDLNEVRTYAGQAVAENGDEQCAQAYELWVTSVDAPDQWVRVGDFHHIMVNSTETGSQVQLSRQDGQPLATRVKKLQFRFIEPPQRQAGFIGIGSPTRYRELEVLGVPTP